MTVGIFTAGCLIFALIVTGSVWAAERHARLKQGPPFTKRPKL